MPANSHVRDSHYSRLWPVVDLVIIGKSIGIICDKLGIGRAGTDVVYARVGSLLQSMTIGNVGQCGCLDHWLAGW